MRKNISQKRGIGLIEIVIGSAIIVTAIVSLISAYNTYVSYALSNGKNVRAALLVEEGVEAVKFLRDMGWNRYIETISPGSAYYLSWNGTFWVATTTPVAYVDDTFKRTFTLINVVRDANDRIASSGTLDSDTRKLIMTVEYWGKTSTTTRSATTYIANINGT